MSTYDSAHLHMEHLGDRFGLAGVRRVPPPAGPGLRAGGARRGGAVPARADGDARARRRAPRRPRRAVRPDRLPQGHRRSLGRLPGALRDRAPHRRARARRIAAPTTRRAPSTATSSRATASACRARRAGRTSSSARRAPTTGGARWPPTAGSARSPSPRRPSSTTSASCSIATATIGCCSSPRTTRPPTSCRAASWSRSSRTRRGCASAARSWPASPGPGDGYGAVVTSKVLNEGVDIPTANVAVVVSGSASVREHVQRLGRILRAQAGKHALLYELVTARHDRNLHQRAAARPQCLPLIWSTARRRGDELRLAPTDDARRARIEALAAALTARRARRRSARARRRRGGAAPDGDGARDRSRRAPARRGGRQAGARRAAASRSRAGEAATELRRELFRRAAAARRAPARRPVRSRRVPRRRRARARDHAAARSRRASTPIAPARQRLLAVEVPRPGAAGGRLRARRGAGGPAARDARSSPSVRARDAALYRRLFRTLKFLRLLAGHHPAGKAAATASRWTGRSACSRAAARYGLSARRSRCRRSPPATPGRSRPTCAGARSAARCGFASAGGRAAARRRATAAGDALPDELATFVTAFERARQRLARSIARRPCSIFPGAGLCVPDLAFVRARDGARVSLRAARLLEPRGGLAPRRSGARRPAPPDPVRRQQEPARRRGAARRHAVRRALRLFARAQRPHDPRSPGTNRRRWLSALIVRHILRALHPSRLSLEPKWRQPRHPPNQLDAPRNWPRPAPKTKHARNQAGTDTAAAAADRGGQNVGWCSQRGGPKAAWPTFDAPRHTAKG